MKKKLLIAVGGVLGLLVIVVVAAILLINPQKLVTEKKDDILKQVSTKIGRQVTAGTVTAQVGSELTARIENLQVAGAAGKQPQLQLGALDMRFSLLRAIFSFGKDLTVERFTVSKLTVRAARDAEGKWDFQDILDAAAGDAKDDDKAPKDKGGGSALDGVRIASLQIDDARVELDDKMLGRPLAIGGLDVDISDVELGKPLAVKVKASLEDGKSKSPVDISARLAVLPKDLSFDPLPDLDVTAKVVDLDLAPWGGLAPADSPAPVAGTLRVDVTVAAKDNLAKLVVDGSVLTRGLTLRDALSPVATAAERASAPRGAPLDVDLAVSLDVDQKKPRYTVKKLTLKGNGLDVNATVDASGTSLAGLDKADVQANAQDLNKVLSALPPSLRGLPEALRIEGPLAAKLTSNGAEIDGSVNLDGAHVRFMDMPEDGTAPTAALFDKAASKPLNLALHGKRSAAALDIDRFGLVLDTAKIGGTLSLPMDDKAALSADITSGAIELLSLQDMLPPFKDAVGRGQKVTGTAELKVKATSAGGKQQADAGLELRSLDVNLASTIVRGSGALTLAAKPEGDTVGLSLTANLDGLSIQKTGEGGALVVNKPAGLPLRLDVDAKKSPTKADVTKLALAIGKSKIEGHGSVTDLDKDTPNLDVDLGDVALGFDDLRTAVPGASKLPAGGRLNGKVKLTGGTSAKTLTVDVKGLDTTFGSSKVAGTIHVKNLSDPVLDVKLDTIDLAFDDVRPMSASTGDLPAGGRFKGTVALTGDTAKSASVHAHVKIDELRAASSDMKGAIDIDNLDKPKFTLGIQSDNLDVDKLRAAFGGGKDDGAKTPEKPAKGAKDSNPHGLTKDTRALLANTNGKGTITAKKAIVKGIPVTAFKGVLVMTRGVARFDTLEFGLYGGTVTATGSSLDLPAERTGYDLRLKGDNIDFGQAMAEQTGLGKVFNGRISPDLSVKGRGLAAGDFAISAEGPAGLTFKSLSLTSLDLLSSISDALGKSNKVPGLKAAAAPKSGGLALDGFKAATQFIGGRLKLDKPVETQSPLGKIVWTGSSGLDAGLDLGATVSLTPQTIATLTGNKFKVKDAVPVPLKIGGTWDKPRVTGVDVAKLITALLGSAAGGLVDDAKDVLKDKGKDAAKDAVKDATKNGGKKAAGDAAKAAADAAKGLLGGGGKKKK